MTILLLQKPIALYTTPSTGGNGDEPHIWTFNYHIDKHTVEL